MGKGFVFIDGIKSDRSTKRAARSHAMKEKNIGKKHNRGLKPAQGKACVSKLGGQCDRKSFNPSVCGSIEPSGSPPVPLVYRSLPPPLSVDATSGSLEVVRTYFTSVVGAVYPSRLCLSLDRIKAYWIRMMFLDQTSYHCSLALMAILNSFVFDREPMSWEATYHLSQAVTMVNEKLGTADALSNSNLAVVNFLVIRDVFIDDEVGATVHLRGLQKMIELRGGLSSIEDRTLALKMAKTDIDFALHYGVSARFFRDCLPQATEELGMACPVDWNPVFSTPCSKEVDPYLEQIISDVYQLSTWFNQDDTCNADPDALQEMIVSIGYRLIRFRPLSCSSMESHLDSVYHIGLIAFLTTLFLQSGGRRFLKYGLVSQRLRGVVEQGLNSPDKRPLLWLLFIGGISVLEEEDQPWLLEQINQTIQALTIDSWTQLRNMLNCFPWIDHMHTRPSKNLWNLATIV